MTILRVLAFGLAVIATFAVPNRAQAQVAVTSCGTVIDNGYLTGDLDCRGIDEDFPVMIHPHGSLDLRGFTLYVGQYSVICGFLGTDPEGATRIYVHGKCTISNGVIRDSTTSAIAAQKLVVKNVSILDSGDRGIQGEGGAPHSDRVEMIDSTIAGSAIGVLATVVVLKGSTVTGNEVGIIAKNAKLRDSSVTGNGANPACTADCVDLRTIRRPRLKNSTCNRSRVIGGGGDWSVCTYDE